MIALLVALAATTSAHAEDVTASLAMHFGVATVPFTTTNFPIARGHGFVSVLSGSYRVAANDEVGVSVPGALVSVAQPAGAYVDELAWGNPTLRAVHGGGDGELRWFARADVSLPLAAHGAPGALLANRALAIAAAIDGWRDPEWFVPGRMSLVPRAGLTRSAAWWSVEASLKLPLLVRVSKADLPDEARTHPIAVVPVVHSAATATIASWLTASTDLDLVVHAVPPAEGARSETRTFQLVIRPALTFSFGRGVLLTADFLAAVSGSLGGSTYAGGLVLTKRW